MKLESALSQLVAAVSFANAWHCDGQALTEKVWRRLPEKNRAKERNELCDAGAKVVLREA